MKSKILGVCCFVFLSTILWSCKSYNVKKYLHKDAILAGTEMSPDVENHATISVRDAISFAIRHLENKGVKNIIICETSWIAEPLGGFLIDGKGSYNLEGKHYSIFRIGIRDGSEGNAGEEFVFIARGEDDKGKAIWYPEPGPAVRTSEGEDYPEQPLEYEFLGDEQITKFESLSDRFK